MDRRSAFFLPQPLPLSPLLVPLFVPGTASRARPLSKLAETYLDLSKGVALGPRVVDHEVGEATFFLDWHLMALSLLELSGGPSSSALHPLAPDVQARVDEDERIAFVTERRRREERYVEDKESLGPVQPVWPPLAPKLFQLPRDFLPHSGMHQSLQSLELLPIGEDLLSHGLTIHVATAIEDGGTEPRDELPAHRRRLQCLMRKLVRVDCLRSESYQHAYYGRFSGSDPA